eukprot:TRINITY_DN6727_c0_g1_i1.p1 TRINITY_DN6727_c0_g1~~TRINITY_DN6727_c0_g1_i1.p1  ORF type:complete len:282 (+),score=27.18 TRINITY_DN6727_c0_g1_i1:125-847(+)
MKSTQEKQLKLRLLQHQFLDKQAKQISKKQKTKSKKVKQITASSGDRLQLGVNLENIPLEDTHSEDDAINSHDTQFKLKNNDHIQNDPENNNNLIDDDGHLQIEFKQQENSNLHLNEIENSDDEKKLEWQQKQLEARNEGINLFGKPWWETSSIDQKQSQQQQQLGNKNVQVQFKKNVIQDIQPSGKQLEIEILGDKFYRQKSLEEIQEEVSSQIENLTDNWKLRRKRFQKLQGRRYRLL